MTALVCSMEKKPHVHVKDAYILLYILEVEYITYMYIPRIYTNLMITYFPTIANGIYIL